MPDNKCKWKPTFGYECNEPSLPYDPDSYCILHSKNEDKDLKDFTAKVEDRLKGTKTEEGKEEIDLRGCYFPKTFPSDYIIERLRNRTFDKPVHFTEATFSQEAYFRGATFSQADFRWAKFSQEAYFHEATFSQAYFHEATFSQAYFFEATFSQEADFSLATFSQVADFRWAKFSEADFSAIAFKKGVDFSNAEFKGRALFLPLGVGENVEFGGSSLFHNTRFSGEVIFQDVDLSKCSFLHSNIDKVDFRYCEFAKKGHRRNVLKDELDCDKNVAKKEVEREKYEPVRRLYLELKRNFEEKKDWNTVGDFHFGEMECRRKMKGWLGRYLISLEASYCWASGYGERPLRAFLILLGFVLIVFPFLFWLSGSSCSSFSASVWDSMRVITSIITRHRNPTALATLATERTVGVLEIIFVPIQTALLALALRRKVRR